FVFRAHHSEDHDESIATFFSRRLGTEAAGIFVSPLLAGIFAGDAKTLSIASTFPQFVEIERRYGSLVRGMRAMRKQVGKEGGKSPFLSLRRGMASVVDKLVTSLEGVDVRTQTTVERVTLADGAEGRYRVDVYGGDSIAADAVVLASSPQAVARMVSH